ncbi:MAG: hypothetical protein WBF71_17265 [Microthrixaceae bacterium]
MKLKVLVVVVLLLTPAVAACQTPVAGPSYNVAPPACPYVGPTIQFHGDSVGAELPKFMNLPGYGVFNASQGGSALTIDSYVPLIGERVHQWIEECGHPQMVIVQGGVNDMASGVKAADILAADRAISDYLAGLGIPAVFLTMHPFANNLVGGEPDGYQWMQPVRLAYNELLQAPDNGLIGTVVDCVDVLEDPADPGWLRPEFYKYEGFSFSPSEGLVPHADGTHMSQDGYSTYADCLTDKIRHLL